jgi:hypothetical protein
MMLPDNLEIIEGEIASYWMEEGILFSLSKPILRTVENIRGNITLVKQITQNKKMPLLIYLTNSPVPDKSTRAFSKEQLPNIYKAMAMVSKPSLAQFIMKLLFKFQQPPIPMKSFSNDIDAKEWLQQFK